MSTAAQPRSEWRRVAGDYLGLIVALGVLILIFSVSTQHFFSADTFRVIANQIPAAVLVATGMTFVLLVAEIDLSVGSVLGLCGAAVGVALTQWHWPLWAAMVAGMGAGACAVRSTDWSRFAGDSHRSSSRLA